MENATNGLNISLHIVHETTTDNRANGVTPKDMTISTNIKTSIPLEPTLSTQLVVNHTNQSYFPTESQDDYYNDYGKYSDFDYGNVYMYTGYSFEKPFYLYIWEFLVIITFLVNLVVISVLLRRNMRNATNVVLTAIAISDSLTGLVTLPSYIMVYLKYVSPDDYGNEYTFNYTYNYDYIPYTGGNNSIYVGPTGKETEPEGGSELTKDLCNGFMISKYFLSKSFHSVSIFLTLFLGIQRYISIRYPYRSQFLLNFQRTIICCLATFVISPCLHVYHLTRERAYDGLCQWELNEQGCGIGCIYLWLAFFIRHLIPCVALVVFTILFILQLRLGERNLRKMESSKSQISRRKDENRRISIVVIAVVIVFLIPEIPYGIFLLYNAVDKTVNQGKGIKLEVNRAIVLVYELFLVLSFHANFYIYTFFNRRFRRTLIRTRLNPVRRLFGDTDKMSFSTTSSISRKTLNKKADEKQNEMESMLRHTLQNQPTLDNNAAANGLLEARQKKNDHQDFRNTETAIEN